MKFRKVTNMKKVEVPAWAGSFETMARRVSPIIHLIDLNKVVTPSEIASLVAPKGSEKDYSAKYVTFLRLLGFEFTTLKEGRNIKSYTCTAIPDNRDDIVNVGPKVAKAKVVKTSESKAKEKPAKAPASSKSVKDIKKRNLAALKSVAAKKPRGNTVKDENNTSENNGSSFSVDSDWDSTAGLDLKSLI